MTQDDRIPLLFNGYISESTGFGVAARAYVFALHEAGADISVFDRSPHKKRVEDSLIRSLLYRKIRTNHIVCHAEPSDFGSFGPMVGQIVGLTVWEGDLLPTEYIPILNGLREVWVPSQFNKEVFSKELSIPVFTLPHPVRRKENVSEDCYKHTLQRCGIVEGQIVYLTIATWQERKNLPAAIAAFCSAFQNDPNVHFVIKTSFAFTEKANAHAQIDRAIKAWSGKHVTTIRDRIRVIDSEFTDSEIQALLCRADCYLSLHRSEGWCYPLFDAACLGIPVVATRYSGVLDYLSEDEHYLVDYTLVPVSQESQSRRFSFTSEMRWADADVSDASRGMRYVRQNLFHARTCARKCANRLVNQFGAKNVGTLAVNRLLLLTQETK